jgi:thiamine biosynthesis lipoprotein
MPTFSIQFKAMGSHMQAWLSAPSAEEAQILAAVPAWFEEWEQILSRFRPTSELSALNAHSGEWFKASPILYEVVADAREASEFSNGVFNPLVLNALEAAGYDRSFDKDAPDDDRPLSAAQSVPAWELIQLDDEREAILLPQGARIDLGGIGKGWAAQMAADKLAAYGPCLVDAGGDLAAHGSPDEQGGWVVNVPTLDESNTLMTLLLVDQAVATSGTDYRNWQRDGKQFHHLIDPRTGRPAQSDILRATVIAPDASEAVVWAKVSLITQQFSEDPTVFVYRDGRVQANLEVQFS